MKRPRRELVACALAMGFAVAGCRGQRSDKPPIHLNPNMDQQAYQQPQEGNPFFADGRAMRPEVPGTIAVGELKEDDHLHRGRLAGAWATTLPMPMSEGLLARGRERFDVYCAPCHDQVGTGDGIVVRRGLLPPPSLHDARIRSMPVGEIYGVISKGVRNMPSYAAQIPPEDRWAIAAYVRALQLSRVAQLSEVPGDIVASRGWTP